MDAKGFFTQDTDCVFQVPFGWAAAVVAVAGYLLLMVVIETTCLMVCCYFVCTKKSRRSSTPVRELSTHKGWCFMPCCCLSGIIFCSGGS